MTVKIPFDKWKKCSRELDLQNSHVSFNGSTQKATVTILRK